MQLIFDKATKQFDIVIINGEIIQDTSPISDCLASIFCSTSWFGNGLVNNNVGSTLENFIKTGVFNNNLQNEIINSIQKSCKWIIGSGRIKNIIPSFQVNGNTSKIELVIAITLPNNQTKLLNIPIAR